MNKIITYSEIEEKVSSGLKKAGVNLPEDITAALLEMRQHYHMNFPDSLGEHVLTSIQENLEIAAREQLPMCQDTGLVWALVTLGSEAPVALKDIHAAVYSGVEKAYREGSFRKSMVEEPVFERRNTKNNLPPIIYTEIVEGGVFSIDLLMKGFGSENCSGLVMVNPTSGADGVVSAVLDIVRKGGGKPCPPIVVGVGIGGTADRALYLSKKALTRELGEPHADPRYAALEERITEAVNQTGIGPGGLGGDVTALGVMLEAEPTHIAGMPVGVTINCWADRKVRINFFPENSEELTAQGGGIA